MREITSKQEAIDLILQQEIVAIFQGQSEWGPRALGNRSLLIKKREWYRPFAGSCLLEHANDWFEMGIIKESPYMTFAIPVKEEKKSLIPCITHVDGTCRIQTVTKEQNKNFYELIDEFYRRTNVPMLFNTSFNLAGEPLVETLDDAHSTIERSNLKYIYLPDLQSQSSEQ